MKTRPFDPPAPAGIKGTWQRAHANRNGMTIVTSEPRRPWLRWPQREARERGDGHRLITAGALLLAVLGLGLLAVSIDAQYRYVLAYRHQAATSVIEATALDVGMLIFSLLALGLARKGLAAKTERALIVACAVGSAVMNYAAADVASPRSVLAFACRRSSWPWWWTVWWPRPGDTYWVCGRAARPGRSLAPWPAGPPVPSAGPPCTRCGCSWPRCRPRRACAGGCLDATPLPGAEAPPEAVSLAASAHGDDGGARAARCA